MVDGSGLLLVFDAPQCRRIFLRLRRAIRIAAQQYCGIYLDEDAALFFAHAFSAWKKDRVISSSVRSMIGPRGMYIMHRPSGSRRIRMSAETASLDRFRMPTI